MDIINNLWRRHFGVWQGQTKNSFVQLPTLLEGAITFFFFFWNCQTIDNIGDEIKKKKWKNSTLWESWAPLEWGDLVKIHRSSCWVLSTQHVTWNSLISEIPGKSHCEIKGASSNPIGSKLEQSYCCSIELHILRLTRICGIAYNSELQLCL